MLFKYYIQHYGQSENIGYAVAANPDEVSNIAKERFAGWAVGSTFGVIPIKDMKKKKVDEISIDIGWIHPAFAKL